MLLSEYAEQHGLIEKRYATVKKVVPGAGVYTIHYRISGQKYRDDADVSKRTILAEVYKTVEVDETNGNILSGRIIKKSNFLVWEPDEESEA